jgi:hypothetical protein
MLPKFELVPHQHVFGDVPEAAAPLQRAAMDSRHALFPTG